MAISLEDFEPTKRRTRADLPRTAAIAAFLTDVSRRSMFRADCLLDDAVRGRTRLRGIDGSLCHAAVYRRETLLETAVYKLRAQFQCRVSATQVLKPHSSELSRKKLFARFISLWARVVESTLRRSFTLPLDLGGLNLDGGRFQAGGAFHLFDPDAAVDEQSHRFLEEIHGLVPAEDRRPAGPGRYL
jgi:hypothetical protein